MVGGATCFGKLGDALSELLTIDTFLAPTDCWIRFNSDPLEVF